MRIPLLLGLSLIFISFAFLQEPSQREQVRSAALSFLGAQARIIIEKKVFVPHPNLPILTVAVVKDPKGLFLEIYQHKGDQLSPFQTVPLNEARGLGHFKYQGRPQKLQMLDRNQDGFGDLLIGVINQKGQAFIQELLWSSEKNQFELSI